MKRSYTDYINIINEMENIERVVITDNRCKKICYVILELIKFLIQYINNKYKYKCQKRKTKIIRQV